MIKNVIIVDEWRFNSIRDNEMSQFILYSDYVIIVKADGFWYYKNRSFSYRGKLYPIDELDYHLNMLERIAVLSKEWYTLNGLNDKTSSERKLVLSNELNKLTHYLSGRGSVK